MLRSAILVLILATTAVAPSAQAPLYADGATGFGLGVVYGRSVGGTDINTFGVEAVATVSPRVDLALSVARASDYRHLGTAAAATVTLYPVVGRHGSFGLVGGLSVPEVDHFDGFTGVGGLTGSVVLTAGVVRVVPQGFAGVAAPFDQSGTSDDPRYTLGGAVAVVWPGGPGTIALEPYVATITSAGSHRAGQTVGLTLRILRSRGA